MIDSGKEEVVSEKVALKNKSKSRPENSFKITELGSTAWSLAWAKSIVGRRVDFPQEGGKLVWGIEIEIPLLFDDIEDTYKNILTDLSENSGNILTDQDIENSIKEKRGRRYYSGSATVKLGKGINKIRILDMSPQEALPKNLRNIESKKGLLHDKTPIVNATKQIEGNLIDRALMKLTTSPIAASKRREALNSLLWDVLGGDSKKRKLFQSILKGSSAEELVIIHAHGGNTNLIGEQTGKVKGPDSNFQAEGNWIDLEEVIKKYNDPGKFAAILVSSCYTGSENPPVDKVAVFRPKGKVGRLASQFPINKTLVSLPKP